MLDNDSVLGHVFEKDSVYVYVVENDLLFLRRSNMTSLGWGRSRCRSTSTDFSVDVGSALVLLWVAKTDLILCTGRE